MACKSALTCAWTVYSPSISVCLTRTVQLVYTIKLDVKDLTWSNIDVAVWNMVESHIGSVAANIPLMGPLFVRVAKRLDHLSRPRVDKASSTRTVFEHRETGRGFKRMNDHSTGEDSVGTMSTTVGSDKVTSENTAMDILNSHGKAAGMNV